MSKLTKAQRDALPADSFGDPARRLFPIVDCSDVSDAATLIGKAANQDKVKARIISIAKSKNCTLPAAWREDVKMSVTFTMDTSGRYRDGDWWVYPNSLLFETGVYEDKNFSLTPEEMWLAVDRFTPVFGNIEHTKFLKGKACEVRSIRFDDADSTILRGEVAVPCKLDDLLEDHERRLSCEWSMDSKMLTGIGLVVDPRVPEAALMSVVPEVEAVFASSRHDTPQGQQVMARIHQVAAEGGAVCSKGNANMASSHEASTIQKIHDMATEHGAACSSTKSGGSSFPSSMYSATPATSTATTSPKEGHAMSWKDRLLAAISGMPDEETGDPAPAPVATPAPVRLSAAPDPRDAEMARMRQERDAAQAEANRLRVESIRKDAVNFADRILKEGRITPAMRGKVIAKFESDAMDDSSYGKVTFGADGTPTPRTTMLEEIFALAKPDQLSASELTPALMSVIQGHRDTPTLTADQKADRAELDRLIGLTSTGQAHQSATTNGRA